MTKESQALNFRKRTHTRKASLAVWSDFMIPGQSSRLINPHFWKMFLSDRSLFTTLENFPATRLDCKGILTAGTYLWFDFRKEWIVFSVNELYTRQMSPESLVQRIAFHEVLGSHAMSHTPLYEDDFSGLFKAAHGTEAAKGNHPLWAQCSGCALTHRDQSAGRPEDMMKHRVCAEQRQHWLVLNTKKLESNPIPEIEPRMLQLLVFNPLPDHTLTEWQWILVVRGELIKQLFFSLSLC